MKKFFRIIQGFGVVIGLLVLATAGQAALYTATQGDGTVSVTTGTNSISITLTDIAVDPTSVIQNISGFVFSTNGGSGVAATAVTPTATYVTIAGVNADTVISNGTIMFGTSWSLPT